MTHSVVFGVFRDPSAFVNVAASPTDALSLFPSAMLFSSAFADSIMAVQTASTTASGSSSETLPPPTSGHRTDPKIGAGA